MNIKQLMLIFISCSILLTVTGYSMAPDEAKAELQKMNIRFDDYPFSKCIDQGDTTAAMLFLEAGINLNSNTYHKKGYPEGATPLMLAAHHGYTDLVNQLLEKGAEVNGENEAGETALIYAARAGYTAIVQMLIQKGAKLEAKIKKVNLGIIRPDAQYHIQTNVGQTALIAAAKFGHTETVKVLLSNGANINAKTDSGETALMLAKKYPEIVKLLQQAGAKE
jgi:ankyrin repeat protein